MKIKFSSIIGAVVLLAASGCVHLPSFTAPKATDPSSVTPRPVSHAAMSQSTAAIQKTVDWYAGLSIIGGLAVVALGAFAIYSGQFVPGIKFVAIGLLLPIFGIWFAYHWLLVVIIALLASALFFLCVHRAIIEPLLEKLETNGANFTAAVLKKF
jgi:sterol desaturase/sphingolipid hydroxylase (fatty acid hydroxylase superfamily)